MKTQRKLLTESQKQAICATHHCDNCKLLFKNGSAAICFKRVEQLEKEIADFWNAEIEVQDENI